MYRLDRDLIDRFPFHTTQALNADTITRVCSAFPCNKHIKEGAGKIVITSRGWKIKLTLHPTKKEITNFVATSVANIVKAVWARPHETSIPIGAYSREVYEQFLQDHYDVLVYYFASLVPGQLLGQVVDCCI